MNVIREIERINEAELKSGVSLLGKGSWHDEYKDSAWVHVGGLTKELSEGDILCVMSQWGEIEDMNLIRDKETGESNGFCFIKYLDQRSTILSVDNFNGIDLLTRKLRVDHVSHYKLPAHIREQEEARLAANLNQPSSIGPGHAYLGVELEGIYTLEHGQDLWANDEFKPTIGQFRRDKEERKDEDKGSSHRHQRKHRHHHRHRSRNRNQEEEEDANDNQTAAAVPVVASSSSAPFNFDDYQKKIRPPKATTTLNPPKVVITGEDGAPLLSWQGNLDPNYALQMQALQQHYDGLNGEKKDEHVHWTVDGIAGMKRRR